jgi:septal ring factor EnvC (AmiA/AmiB activator)
MVLLTMVSWAHGAHTPNSLDKLSAEIAAVENDILAGDIRSVGVQLVKLRRLIGLQRKEIKLNEKKTNELSEKLKSLSLQKQNLHSQIEQSRLSLYSSLKVLALTAEDQRPASFRALDAMWMASEHFNEARAAYVSRLAENRNALLATLLEERSALLELEAKISKEKEHLEYYANDLKEKESSLVANEELQKNLIKNRQLAAQEEIKRMARLKDIRDSENGLQKAIEKQTTQASQVGQSGTEEAFARGLALWKGQLPWPVSGKIISEYGRHYDPKTSLHTFQKGVSIAAFGGTEVKTVGDGKIVYAGELRNYGRMVIVEHPGNYFTLYGHLGRSRVKEGQVVAAGAVVGETSAEGAPLYFEIRNKNIAVNPMQWFKQVSVGLNR